MSSQPTQSSPLGPFTEQRTIGPGRLIGQASYEPQHQALTVAGAGANIWGEADSFHFVYRELPGDFILTARAAFADTPDRQSQPHPHRKLGWMARAALDPGAPMVCAAIHGDGLLSLQFRREPGGQVEEVKAPLNGADVVQLERRGSAYVMSVAQFGEPFSSVEAYALDWGDELKVGVFVCSHEEEVIETAVFDNLRIVKPAAPGFDRSADPFASRLEILEVDSGLRRIVYAQNSVFEAPNWTRDGKALIYNSQGRLFRFDLGSLTPTSIDTGSVIHNNNDHVISFDGRTLSISSHDPETGHSLIYTVPVEGGQPRLLTPTGPSYLHGWSPDGRFLVYCAERRAQYDIYRIGAHGGAEEQLTSTPGLDDGPEYAPDGSFIYFNSVRSGRMQIWRMRPDGSRPEQLTDDAYNNWFAHVSPDGARLIFLTYLVGETSPSDHPAARRVYLRTMPVDGGSARVVAYLYGGQGSLNVPSWSPDSARVAFVSNTVPF